MLTAVAGVLSIYLAISKKKKSFITKENFNPMTLKLGDIL
jgi:hypothetical protein